MTPQHARDSLSSVRSSSASYGCSIGPEIVRPSRARCGSRRIENPRTVKTPLRFFRWLRKEESAGLRFVCGDMWKPFLKVIVKKAGQAIHVLDRFHIMAI